nr:MAG TPA: hypothetical protein [Caudoviricetes sp.]
MLISYLFIFKYLIYNNLQMHHKVRFVFYINH